MVQNSGIQTHSFYETEEERNGDSMIHTHSFYEVNQKNYTDEELKLYRDLTGMPSDEAISNFLDLNDSMEETSSNSKRKVMNNNELLRK